MGPLNNTESREIPKNNDKNKAAKKRVAHPLPFKLKLIDEVKKHDIIWENFKDKKNPDLVENAWQKVRKVLRVNKVGLCENQWKLLILGYRKHINRNTPMNTELIQKMHFMTSQLKKSSSDEQSDNELEPDSPPRNKAKTPKATKETKRNSISEAESSEDQKASVAILKLLFGGIPADVMRPVRNTLVEVLIRLMPEIDTKLSDHAKQQVKMGGDINKIDWSGLNIPSDVCKAVWDYKVVQMVFNV